MTFNDLAWSAFLNWYITKRDEKYVELFINKPLIYALREHPSSVDPSNFHEKVVSDFLNSWGRMFIQKKTSYEILDAITELNPYLLVVRDESLLTCDLSNGSTVNGVVHAIYERLSSIDFIDMTGTSKIAHILNDSLFVMIDNEIRKKYKKKHDISRDAEGYINWMKIMQQQARDVTADFRRQGFSSSPEGFLSRKLSYTAKGCSKSMARLLDEYYWITITAGLPIPPEWIPISKEKP